MKYLWTLLLTTVFMLGCATIQVDRNARKDTTPPVLSAYLPGARALGATYSDNGEPITNEAPLDTGKPFRVSLRADNQPMGLAFVAIDSESGISNLGGLITARFICGKYLPGGWWQEEVTAGVSTNFSDPALPDEEIPDRRIVAVSFTLEDLWRKSCTRLGGFINVNGGSIRDVQLTYSAISGNNAIPGLLTPPFDGSFRLDFEGWFPVDVEGL